MDHSNNGHHHFNIQIVFSRHSDKRRMSREPPSMRLSERNLLSIWILYLLLVVNKIDSKWQRQRTLLATPFKAVLKGQSPCKPCISHQIALRNFMIITQLWRRF